MRRPSTLQIALGVSLALHGVLLALRFGAPETFNRVFQDTPLEVVLVNARSNEKPTQAQALAQASLAGGGEAAKGRASSPLPYSALTNAGDSADEARRQIDQLIQQQEQLLAVIRKEIAALPVPDPFHAADTPERLAQEERRRQLVKLLAEIERRINEENARPRKRYISPATREVAYAIYYDALRRRIEDRGTRHFPEAGGEKLYGELTMIVTVRRDGQVVATEVVQSSGNKQLDRRAESIARAAGPFGPFDAQMLREVDQIVVVSRFKFTRDATLEANVR
ncbi:TonB family protein [Xylophilus rhododendri]|uniref:TonB family protein n=1 Tax=Xylophilus rhododendri TaxID=2697032 RepID=A0A857J9L4_9BURK|nr:TonB family protein [Xylophilus rhododendri]QHI99801.1 TonB family protein [Xylophilus rhododendri]